MVTESDAVKEMVVLVQLMLALENVPVTFGPADVSESTAPVIEQTVSPVEPVAVYDHVPLRRPWPPDDPVPVPPVSLLPQATTAAARPPAKAAQIHRDARSDRMRAM